MLCLCTFVNGWADPIVGEGKKATLSSTTSINGSNAQGHFALKAKLLTGLPFEMSFNVTTDGSSFNQWGSCLFATGENALANIYPNGFQLYLRSGSNGGYMIIKIGAGETRFNNIVYNQNFSLSFAYDGKSKLVVTATNTKTSVSETKEFTVSNIDITNFCYALPTGININNLSLTCDAKEIQALAKKTVSELEGREGMVGFPTVEACERITRDATDAADALVLYQEYLSFLEMNAATTMPQIGKVYYIASVIRTNPVVAQYLTYNNNAFSLQTTPPDPSNTEVFQYMWVPKEVLQDGNPVAGEMYLASTSGTKKQLKWDGKNVDVTGTEWIVKQGKSYGFISMMYDADYYVAASATGTFGGDRYHATAKAQATTANPAWATDFVFAEAPFTAFDLKIVGLTGEESATVSYQQSDNHAVQMDGLQDGDVVIIPNSHISSLSPTEFTAVAGVGGVGDKTPVITIDNGTIIVLYTSYTALKAAAEQELYNASQRLSFSSGAGALYKEIDIDEANSAIEAAVTQYNTNTSDAANVKKAMDMITVAMDKFFRTIDGKYVTMSKTISESNKFIKTTGKTNLGIGTSSDLKEKYFGVYKLLYVGNGTYQLESAYYKNWMGQTTSTANLGSCLATTAEKWRGDFQFQLSKNHYNDAEAYKIYCTNGVKQYLGINGDNVIKHTPADVGDTVYWDVRLANIAEYATAFINNAKFADQEHTEEDAPKTNGYNQTIGYKTAYNVTKALEDVKGKVSVTDAELVAAINTFYDNRDDINLPVGGEYLTFQNVGYNTYYLSENHYEQASTTSLSLGAVWQVERTNGNFYLKNAKTGRYMGSVAKSATARMTEKAKQPFDFISIDGATGKIVLNEVGTGANSGYAYIHLNSSHVPVGWSYAGVDASHWTVADISNSDALRGYYNDATTAVRTKIGTAKQAWNDLANDSPSKNAYYAKSDDDVTAAETERGKDTQGANLEEAVLQYNTAVTAYKTFNEAGTAIADNEVVLLRTRKQFTISDVYYNLYVNGVMNDGADRRSGSMMNGESTNGDSQYYFSAWQLIKDGDFYRLKNFFTDYYVSKDVSESWENTYGGKTRYGLTIMKEDAALFRIENHDGWYITLHRADYDERNDGYLLFVDFNSSGFKIRFGTANGRLYDNAEAEAACQYELLPVGATQYAKCMMQLLEYRPLLGEGIGKYTDVMAKGANSYTTLTEPYANYTQVQWNTMAENNPEEIIALAKKIAPSLAYVQINLPTSHHYYRMYSLGEETGNTTSRHYIKATGTANNCLEMVKYTENTEPEFSDEDLMNTIFYFDGKQLLNLATGKHIGSASTPWHEGGIGEMFEFKFANTGYTSKGCYSIKPKGRSFLYNNYTSNGSLHELNGWGTAYDARCEWYLEELTALPVKISNVGYSTLCSPAALEIPAGVKAYVASDVSGSVIALTEIKKGVYADDPTKAIIPANTPVLLKANAGTTYYFPLSAVGNTDEYEYKSDEYFGTIPCQQYVRSNRYYPENKFRGSIPLVNNTKDNGITPANGGTTYYTLQNPASWTSPQDLPVGFYGYTGTLRQPFKAYYMSETPAPSKGFTLNFVSVTGTDNAPADAITTGIPDAIFDLGGRRIIEMSAPGLYILNGKKLLRK